MKKKGFTLVELLAVITVIAIIGLISVPVVEGIVNEFIRVRVALITVLQLVYSS